jgi:hypothetical protein
VPASHPAVHPASPKPVTDQDKGVNFRQASDRCRSTDLARAWSYRIATGTSVSTVVTEAIETDDEQERRSRLVLGGGTGSPGGLRPATDPLPSNEKHTRALPWKRPDGSLAPPAGIVRRRAPRRYGEIVRSFVDASGEALGKPELEGAGLQGEVVSRTCPHHRESGAVGAGHSGSEQGFPRPDPGHRGTRPDTVAGTVLQLPRRADLERLPGLAQRYPGEPPTGPRGEYLYILMQTPEWLGEL